jgi:hypothetical protein
MDTAGLPHIFPTILTATICNIVASGSRDRLPRSDPREPPKTVRAHPKTLKGWMMALLLLVCATAVALFVVTFHHDVHITSPFF